MRQPWFWATLLVVPTVAFSQSATTYSTDQVEAGKKVYDRACTACHGATLGGSAMASPLVGFPFTNYWSKKTLSELKETLLTMPAGAPGSLSVQEYSDTLAYILSVNAYPAGETALDLGDEDLSALLGTP